MVNGNTILEHEENNIQRLEEEFKEKYKDLWTEFVLDDYDDSRGN